MAGLIGIVPTMVLSLFSAIRRLIGPEEAPPLLPGMMIAAGIVVVCVVFVPLVFALWTLASAGGEHLILRLTGETRSFAVTFRAAALSSGPMIFGIIPIYSMYVLPFWVMGVRTFAYGGLHRISAGRGALAVILPAVFCCFSNAILSIAFYRFFSGSGAPG